MAPFGTAGVVGFAYLAGHKNSLVRGYKICVGESIGEPPFMVVSLPYVTTSNLCRCQVLHPQYRYFAKILRFVCLSGQPALEIKGGDALNPLLLHGKLEALLCA